MYEKIYVPLDNSPYSDAAARLSVAIAQPGKSRLVGSHVYAAKLHDQRFRSMEGGLPEEYQQEKELVRQREVHDTLITKGLELITDSYLSVMENACRGKRLEFSGVSLEGKNWKALVEDIEEHDYDLVVMGANGMGKVPESVLGSVTERVARRIRTDLLIVKEVEEQPERGKIMVCLDGSTRSFGALKTALSLASRFGKQVEAVSTFDPYFHYGMFNSLNEVLSDRARKVFKFEEQEKLHEEIIDSGLAKIYQSHLDIARRIAGDEDEEIKTRLLDGKAWRKILAHVREDPPWLLVLGRIGIHSDEEMDLGSNTENLMRLAPCNLLITDRQFTPPVEYQAEETIGWTQEARGRMDRVPEMARGVAMKAIQQHAVAEGHTMITSDVVDAAVKSLLPPQAVAAMGIEFSENNEEAELYHETFRLSFECEQCRYVHHRQRPKTCPVCGADGANFRILDDAPADTTPEKEGVTETTFDGRRMTWSAEAKMRMNHVSSPESREHLRRILEKRAHVRHRDFISLEMVEEALAEEGESPSPEFQWTDDAVKRLARVPEGFMRKAAQTTIEEYASGQGVSRIDLGVAEEGLAAARQKMQQAMQTAPGAETAAALAESGTHECLLCGYTVKGKKPSSCAACGSSDFKLLSEDERKIVPEAAFLILDWDQSARERLRKIPSGFMREMTKNRIEQWARKFNKPRVTLEVVEAKYASWGEGSKGLVSQMNWSDDARERIGRVPDFIRPMVQLEVERQARERGQNLIDGAMLDYIMEQWGTNQRFHRKSS